MVGRKLTKREAAFVAALPKVNWIGTDAAIRAKYRAKDRQGMAEIASRLCKRKQVEEAIDRMMDESLRRAGIYAEKVLLELGKIGFSDVSKAYKEDGTLKLPKDWPEELKGVISGVETLEEFSGRGENRQLIGFTKKLRTFDKVKSLELLGKHLKLFPIERRGEESEPPKGQVPLSNLELSAKVFYILQLAIQRQQEHDQQAKQEQITEK